MNKQVLLSLILILFSYLGITIIKEYRSYSAPQLSELWETDILQLKANGHLHKGIKSLQSVEFVFPEEDSLAATWADNLSSPFPVRPNGEYRLEVLLISEELESGYKVDVLHHLIHLSSGNSIWELGRTYSF